MDKMFNNKRHKELKRKFVGARSLKDYFRELGLENIKKSGRSVEEFAAEAINFLGKDSYNQKIEKYKSGFENGNYLKTDLSYSQRIAHNIREKDYHLSKKR